MSRISQQWLHLDFTGSLCIKCRPGKRDGTFVPFYMALLPVAWGLPCQLRHFSTDILPSDPETIEIMGKALIDRKPALGHADHRYGAGRRPRSRTVDGGSHRGLSASAEPIGRIAPFDHAQGAAVPWVPFWGIWSGRADGVCRTSPSCAHLHADK